ncbi:MAG: vWA domain-containing protein [Parvicellaceae bacterium]
MNSWFDKYQFSDQWALWLLFIIPIAFLCYLFLNLKRNQSIKISSLDLFKGIRNQYMTVFKHLKFGLKLLGISFLIIAMARPQVATEAHSETELYKEGIDIVISMDASGSMLAKDFSPNRFEASKDLAKEFVKDRKNDRVGLVIFEGEAYTQCPLTSDRDILVELIESAEQGIVEQGTAIGMGLATAVNRLRESEAPSKVIILLTDGVNTHGKIHPLNATEIAKEFNIRVYTIGVGTNGKAKTPVAIDPFSGRYIYDFVDVEIDEETLGTIAQETGGKYFRATDNNKLKEVYKEINEMEKAKIKTIEYDVDLPEKAGIFILLGIAILLFEFFISKFLIPSVS